MSTTEAVRSCIIPVCGSMAIFLFNSVILVWLGVTPKMLIGQNLHMGPFKCYVRGHSSVT